MSTTELLERKGELFGEIEALHNKVTAEDRDFTDDENKTWERLNSDYDQVDKQLKRAERVAAIGKQRDVPDDRQRVETSDDGVVWRDNQGREIRAYDIDSAGSLLPQRAKDDESLTLGGLLLARLKPQRATPAELRQLSTLTDAQGAASVPIVTMKESIPALTQASTLMQAGARVVPLETNATVFASMVTPPTPAVRAEEAAVATSQPVLGRVTLTPFSHACSFQVSEELLADSVNIREMLQRAAVDAMAQVIDAKGLTGVGTTDVLGITQDADCSTTAAAPTALPTTTAPYAGPLELVRVLQQAGLRSAPTAHIASPVLWQTWESLQGGAEFQPVMGPASFEARQKLVTQNAFITDHHYYITGDFSQCALGVRLDTQVEFIKATDYVDNLLWNVVIHARFDWVRLQAAAVGYVDYDLS